MICPNCENKISFNKNKCDRCGNDLVITKKVIKLSNAYYNQGLERVKIRDLSGAIVLLKNSLKLDKRNTEARNLLGLTYFETGEIVKALSEWVISKHFKSDNNQAEEYLEEIQSNPTKLESYNNIIKRYNQALLSAKQDNDDISIIQLKKIISANPNYIAAIQLLALQYIKNKDYNKAKKILNRAKKIDITNPRTLRYLYEIDLAQSNNEENFRREDTLEDKEVKMSIVPLSSYKEDKPSIWIFINLLIGVIVGIVAMYILVIPTIKREYDISLNNKYAEYNAAISKQEDQDDVINGLRSEKEELEIKLAKLQEEIDGIVIPDVKDNLKVYDKLLDTVNKYIEALPSNKEKMIEVAESLSNIQLELLETNKAKDLYQTIKEATYETASTTYYRDGYNHYDRGKYEEAKDSLEKSYLFNESNLDALYFLGRSYQRLGDNDQARFYYDILINDHEGSRRANQAKEQLRYLE